MSGLGRLPLQTRARQPRPRALRARRHQSRSAGVRPLGEGAKRGRKCRKPPAETLLEKLSAVLLSQPRGALDLEGH